MKFRLLSLVVCTTGYLSSFGQCLTTNGDLSLTTNWNACPGPSAGTNITEFNPETSYGGTNAANQVAEIDVEASLCQNITGLTAGTTYVLSFNYAFRQSPGMPATIPLELSVPTIAGITTLNVTDPGFWQWQSYTQFFTATGTNGLLSIVTNAAYTNTLGAIIDNVCISPAVGPGGVFEHTLWYKANAGTSTVANNTPLINWTSQSYMPGITVTEGTNANRPIFRNGSGAAGPIATSQNTMNYNPYVLFDGTNDKLQISGLYDFGNSTNGLSNFNAFKPTNTNGIVYFEWGGLNASVKNKSDGNHVITNGSGALGTNNQFACANNVNPKITHLIGRHTGLIGNFNGENHVANNTFSSNDNPSGVTDRISIGSNVNAGEFAAVSIGEIVIINKLVSAAEQLRVNSYLAVKYGITLGANGIATNYLRADGTNIWNGPAAYHNWVIGIGRDDASAFVQKQSHQDDDLVRLYLSTLATTNLLNTGTFAANGSYIMMGSNTGNLCATAASNAEVPSPSLAGCALYSRLEREWRLQRTNSTETFSVDISLAACGNPAAVNTAHLRLLVDNDGNFANGGTQCYFIGDGTGINFNYANPRITVSGLTTTHFPNNTVRFFTIASINPATPLPVELTDFDAECDEHKVQLSWESQSEINNDYYTVERSSDGINFDKIATVSGAGTSATSLSYSWTDNMPMRTANYYRLSQTDFDGVTEVFQTRYVNCNNPVDQVEVYPIPASEEVVILSSRSGTIVVIDNLGQKLLSEPIEAGENSIKINELAKGSYYVQALLENGTTKVIKIVKN